jgi:16S rRNA (uracil1498-N3)-methyltransferase
MRNSRIVVSAEEITGEIVKFSEKKAYYVARVLRLKPGNLLHVVYTGTELLTEIQTIDPGHVTARVIRVISAEDHNAPEIILAFSCVRPGPMEQILRHGTELGVSSFAPIITARSNRRPILLKKRWQHIVESAVEQCGRSTIPIVNAPTGLDEFLRRRTRDESGFLLSVRQNVPSLISELEKGVSPRIVLLVGPEGGFEEMEIGAALAAGLRPVGLGKMILRTETAVLLAVGIVSVWHNRQPEAKLPVEQMGTPFCAGH